MIVTVTLNPSLDEWVSLPRLTLGDLNRAGSFQRYPAGKGINVSRVVHELGGSTLAVALAGGEDGTILGDLLNQQGIRHRFVTVNGTTRNNYQIHTERPTRLTQINCAGPRITVKDLSRLEAALRRLRPHASCVVCSGSLPPGAPSTTYRRLLRFLRARRMLTVLDASGHALRQGLSAQPWLIKPNRSEAEELLARRLRRLHDVGRAARQLLARGARVAIVSLGPAGAVLAAHALPGVWWAKSPRVKIDSSVGAGDSLVAGFLVGWVRTRSFHTALQLGVACGAATAMTPGTELCHAADVKRLMRRVTIQALG